MKRIFFIVVLITCCFVGRVSAQILKESKKTLEDGTVVRYTTQYGVASGLYTANLGMDKENIVRGNYLDGKRKGNWYFFNYDKKLFLRFNYDINKAVQLDQKSLAVFQVKINSDDQDIKKGASIPVPIWSFDSFYVLATEKGKEAVGAEAKRYLNDRVVNIKVSIDEQGLAKYYVVYTMDKKDYSKEFILNNEALDIKWIPAHYNGKDYKSEVTFATKFQYSPSESRDGHRRTDWNN